MLTADELTAMRETSDSALPDTGTITRAGVGTFSTATGLLTAGASTTIYSGAMRVRPSSATSTTDVSFGEQQVTLSQFVLTVPYDTDDVQPDDIVTVTASDDADLLARTLRVTAVPLGSFMVSKRFPLEVVE